MHAHLGQNCVWALWRKLRHSTLAQVLLLTLILAPFPRSNRLPSPPQSLPSLEDRALGALVRTM